MPKSPVLMLRNLVWMRLSGICLAGNPSGCMWLAPSEPPSWRMHFWLRVAGCKTETNIKLLDGCNRENASELGFPGGVQREEADKNLEFRLIMRCMTGKKKTYRTTWTRLTRLGCASARLLRGWSCDLRAAGSAILWRLAHRIWCSTEYRW
jgi:hypothetical protein